MAVVAILQITPSELLLYAPLPPEGGAACTPTFCFVVSTITCPRNWFCTQFFFENLVVLVHPKMNTTILHTSKGVFFWEGNGHVNVKKQKLILFGNILQTRELLIGEEASVCVPATTGTTGTQATLLRKTINFGEGGKKNTQNEVGSAKRLWDAGTDTPLGGLSNPWSCCILGGNKTTTHRVSMWFVHNYKKGGDDELKPSRLYRPRILL